MDTVENSITFKCPNGLPCRLTHPLSDLRKKMINVDKSKSSCLERSSGKTMLMKSHKGIIRLILTGMSSSSVLIGVTQRNRNSSIETR